MKKKVCLITGATSGIGKAASFELAKQGHEVLLLGRNQDKLLRTSEHIRSMVENARIESFCCDLSMMSDVKSTAEVIKQAVDHIDVLIDNAGGKYLDHEVTSEGIERTLATNHIGHFVLTLNLIDLLKKAEQGRIVIVSSGAHYSSTGIINNVLAPESYDGRKQYSDSKLANVLFAYALADRLSQTSITVNAIDPGGVATNFARNNGFVCWAKHWAYHLYKRELQTPERAAIAVVFLAVSAEVSGLSGRYFLRSVERESSKVSYDLEAQARLWKNSVALSGIDL